MEAVPRPLEGRLQETPVPETERAAMGLDLIGMDSEDVDEGQPAGLAHLASSRMALRYRLAPSA